MGENKVIIVVRDDHYFHNYIPTELDADSGFNGLEIDIEHGGLYFQGGAGGCRSGGRAIQGGTQINCQPQGEVGQ